MRPIQCSEILVEIEKINKQYVIDSTRLKTELDVVRFVEAYDSYVQIHDLVELLIREKEPEVVFSTLKAQIAQRWGAFKKADFIYPYDRSNPCNRVYEFVAEKLVQSQKAQYSPRDIYSMLMPTLVFDPSDEIGINKPLHSLSLPEFILSDDGERHIEIFPTIDLANQDGKLHYYRHSKLVELSKQEQARLLQTPEALHCFELITLRLQSKHLPSLGSEIFKLRHAIEAGSERANGVEVSKDAGSAANIGIAEFYVYFSSLSKAKQQEIRDCKTKDGLVCFNDIWILLCRQLENTDYENLIYCLDTLGGELELILDNNPHLFPHTVEQINQQLVLSMKKLQVAFETFEPRPLQAQLSKTEHYDELWQKLMTSMPAISLCKHKHIHALLHTLSINKLQSLLNEIPFGALLSNPAFAEHVFRSKLIPAEKILAELKTIIKVKLIDNLIIRNTLDLFIDALGPHADEYLASIDDKMTSLLIKNEKVLAHLEANLSTKQISKWGQLWKTPRKLPLLFCSYPRLISGALPSMDPNTLQTLSQDHLAKIIEVDAMHLLIRRLPTAGFLSIAQTFTPAVTEALAKNENAITELALKSDRSDLRKWFLNQTSTIKHDMMLVSKDFCRVYLQLDKVLDLTIFNLPLLEKISEYRSLPNFLAYLGDNLYAWLKKQPTESLTFLFQSRVAAPIIAKKLSIAQITSGTLNHWGKIPGSLLIKHVIQTTPYTEFTDSFFLAILKDNLFTCLFDSQKNIPALLTYLLSTLQASQIKTLMNNTDVQSAIINRLPMNITSLCKYCPDDTLQMLMLTHVKLCEAYLEQATEYKADLLSSALMSSIFHQHLMPKLVDYLHRIKSTEQFPNLLIKLSQAELTHVFNETDILQLIVETHSLPQMAALMRHHLHPTLPMIYFDQHVIVEIQNDALQLLDFIRLTHIQELLWADDSICNQLFAELTPAEITGFADFCLKDNRNNNVLMPDEPPLFKRKIALNYLNLDKNYARQTPLLILSFIVECGFFNLLLDKLQHNLCEYLYSLPKSTLSALLSNKELNNEIEKSLTPNKMQQLKQYVFPSVFTKIGTFFLKRTITKPQSPEQNRDQFQIS